MKPMNKKALLTALKRHQYVKSDLAQELGVSEASIRRWCKKHQINSTHERIKKVKILFLDIETAPNVVYSWGLFEQNIGLNQIIKDGYVLCWAAKWLDQTRLISDAIVNYPSYFKKNPTSDKKIAASMWKLLDEADIVVTHNGDNFDIKWLNTIFLKHKMPPPSPFKSIDTLKASRSSFRFTSNKLAFILKTLGLTHKIENEGFKLWVKCIEGHKPSWKIMLKYCGQDVKSLEELYYEIRPYIKGHPNLAIYQNGSTLTCPACNSESIAKNGYSYTGASKYQRYACLESGCGKNFRGSKSLIKTKGVSLPRNIVG